MLLAEAGADTSFASFDVPIWGWGALLATIAAMLSVDLFLHREHHEPTPRRALRESLIWITIGVAFAGVIAIAFGGQAFGEYLSGYVIEKSLSIDNVFVWAVIFASFAIPDRYQHRVLFWGIFGALTLRAVFIALGSALLAAVWWTLLVFGAVLIYTGIKVLRHREDEGEVSHERAVALLGRFIPVTDRLDGHHFFTRIDGKRFATPLLAALVVVEVSDVIFAVDSVPAVLAVSREPFIVFASNAFAILGLRALYFLLAGMKARFHYLSHALGGILIFVGMKMMVSHWWHMPTYVSLIFIFSVLIGAVVASERKTRLLARLPDEPDG